MSISEQYGRDFFLNFWHEHFSICGLCQSFKCQSSSSVYFKCREKPCCSRPCRHCFETQMYYKYIQNGRKNMYASTPEPISVTASEMIMIEWWRNSLLGCGFNVNISVPLRDRFKDYFPPQKKKRKTWAACKGGLFSCLCKYSWYCVQVFVVQGVMNIGRVCVCVYNHLSHNGPDMGKT